MTSLADRLLPGVGSLGARYTVEYDRLKQPSRARVACGTSLANSPIAL
jgi:hypothetical protein